MARKRGRGTELDVFRGKKARLNLAIFDVLASDGPKNLKTLRKHVVRYEGLDETYFASLTKRIRALENEGYVKAKPAKKPQTPIYKLTIKGYLRLFVGENDIEEILDEANETDLAYILLAFLNAASHRKTQKD